MPIFSWSPFKHCLPGIFQAKKSLLDLPTVTWSDVEAAIRIKCKKHPNWLEGNLQLAELMFNHVNRSEMKAREWSFGPLPVGHGAAVKFWPDFYCVEEDRPLILYPNHFAATPIRVERGKLIRTFVKSAVSYLEISPKIIGGNSGGPVLNEAYQVIGVAVRGLNGSTELASAEFLAVNATELLALLK